MKKTIASILIGLVVLLTACGGGGGKTVTDKEKVKELTEAFYSPLSDADNYKMESYYEDVLTTVLTKERDKMHVENIDDEFSYDYFCFMEDGKKYVISDDRTLFEDDATYDFAAETLSMLMDMIIPAYMDAGAESVSYSATPKGDNELVTTIQGKDEESAFTITVTGKKENHNISEIIYETKYGDESYTTRYSFTYDEHVELPEYTVPKTYDNMPHVESPYKTFGEIIEKLGEDEYLSYLFDENQLIVTDEKDGKQYQFSTIVDQDIKDQFDALDFMNDDYEHKVYELISDIEIEDCIDFTDEIIPQDSLDAYVGKNIQALVDDGYEISGYSFFEDSNTVFVSKDFMEYQADVKLPEGFDPDSELDYEELGDCLINRLAFNAVEYSALPMK